MPLLVHQPITQISFALHENPRVFALLLGSGLSQATGIPTGWDITLDLIRRIGLAEGVEGVEDWEAWYRERTGQAPDYSVLLKELGRTRDERRSILDTYIEPDEYEREEGKKQPTAAHRAIAALVQQCYCRVLITTNFDRLLETALRDEGVEPTVIFSRDTLNGAPPYVHTSCFLVKLHGDYKDARLLNTDSELTRYPREYERLLDRILDDHGLIVSGWSGTWDEALRHALLRQKTRRYPVFWTSRTEPSESAKEIIKHRDALVVRTVSADELFTSLRARVEALHESRRPHPGTVEVLVQTVKRDLTREQYRIQLDDLVQNEVDDLLAGARDPEFSAQGPMSEDDFRHRVIRYEALSERLFHIAGVLGRWGDGRERNCMVDVMRTLIADARHERAGLVVALTLRDYPAALIATAYCLGLLRVERWTDLHWFLTSEILIDGTEPSRIVDVAIPQTRLQPELQQQWQIFFEGNRKTPLSDRLAGLVKESSSSFLGLTPDLERLFDWYEVLCSLAYLEKVPEEDLERAAGETRGRPFVPMPMGRVGWRGFARSIIQEILSEQRSLELVRAGFALSSRRFLELFADNLTRRASQMEF